MTKHDINVKLNALWTAIYVESLLLIILLKALTPRPYHTSHPFSTPTPTNHFLNCSIIFKTKFKATPILVTWAHLTKLLIILAYHIFRENVKYPWSMANNNLLLMDQQYRMEFISGKNFYFTYWHYIIVVHNSSHQKI